MRSKTLSFLGIIAAALGVVVATTTHAQDQPKGPTVTRASGGSIRTVLSGSIVLNKRSTLDREWIAMHDPALPLTLEGTPGAATSYTKETTYTRAGYEYSAQVEVTPTEDLVAINVRFLLFDVWGGHIRTLGIEEVIDLPANTPSRHSGTWTLWSENECCSYYASIAYVARVRTKAGKVIEGDTRAVLDEARKFSAKFTAADLEPEKKKPDGK